MSNRLNLFESMYDDQGQPAPFTRAELEPLEDLWEQRAALFFTPTSEIPERFVGSGELQVSLPIVTPSYGEFEQIPGYRNTRMWVDLLQRATGKIRWRPMDPVTIVVVRKDVCSPGRYATTGAKALTDAYKVSSTGRRDGHRVHYFGAIVDDTPCNIGSVSFTCVQVQSRAEVGVDIKIKTWEPQDGTECREVLPNGSVSTSR
ncbi:hypothetical protein [Polyangium jinanense]|uniref:Uncharacterized protein n=1 Tax=Polyangium jinanense TaxID=2829994 RepID=A0A9X3X8S8_9BACT|nr:hypothetical protein [Polyangium jinanense]MDC3958920.1 hypothetical protein [Polyangium jinanense]MDC3986034.1 hypothetical protein [Polyangium jinanense]